MRKRGTIVSALPALTPTLILDPATGEILPMETLQGDVSSLVHHVRDQSEAYYLANKASVLAATTTYTGTPQPEAFARKQGWNMPVTDRAVKAKSRVERLTRYHLVQTVTSFVLNPNPRKAEPGFGLSVNLGAVDTQMVRLELNGDTLILKWKCWEREYELHFSVPPYLVTRAILKYSLPVVRWDRKKEAWVFNFTVLEDAPLRPNQPHTAGVDLGRVEPFTMAVVNEAGKRVADYTSSGRLRQLNLKRERLIRERAHIRQKITAYESLNMDTTVLELESARKRDKIRRLGAAVAHHVGSEIVTKLAPHKVSILSMENLSWVQGRKYGGRWNHAAQQAAVTHAVARKGIRARKVNPKNTSQACHKCGTTLVHATASRTVWCVACKSRLNRDFNAAMNIALRPTNTVGSGPSVEPKVQVGDAPNVQDMVGAQECSAGIASLTTSVT